MPPVTLRERNNVDCPECGSILNRCRGGGRSAEGHRLRRRICDDCKTIFTTVEVPVLYNDGSPVPLTALDDDHRWYHRQEQRRRVKYWGGPGGQRPYEQGARLRVSVKALPPRRRAA